MSHQCEDLCSAAYLISFGDKETLIDAVLFPGIYIFFRKTHTCKYTHKSSTVYFSQEIITVINVLACSLVAALIG